MLDALTADEIEHRRAGRRADRDVGQQRVQRMAEPAGAEKILDRPLADNLRNGLRGGARGPYRVRGPAPADALSSACLTYSSRLS
jgi:hypothetical protein